MSNDDAIRWAKDLVDRHAWVMNIGARVIGRASKLFDGNAEQYVSPVNDTPVTVPVVQLEQGHTFVAHPDAFIELSDREAEFFQGAQVFLTGALGELAKVGAERGVRPATMTVLIISALRTQASFLEAQHDAFMREMQKASDQ